MNQIINNPNFAAILGASVVLISVIFSHLLTVLQSKLSRIYKEKSESKDRFKELLLKLNVDLIILKDSYNRDVDGLKKITIKKYINTLEKKYANLLYSYYDLKSCKFYIQLNNNYDNVLDIISNLENNIDELKATHSTTIVLIENHNRKGLIKKDPDQTIIESNQDKIDSIILELESCFMQLLQGIIL